MSDSALTPSSQRISLVACSGCSLNNPTGLLRKHYTKPNKRLCHLPGVFNIEHEEAVSLKEFHIGKLDPLGINALRGTYFHVSHLIRESLRPYLSDNPQTSVNLSKDLIDKSHPFQYGIFFNFKNEFIRPPTSPRLFAKYIFEAQCFSKFITLQRCNFISFLNNNRCIDWPATWSRFKNCSNQPKSHTSFKKSIHMAFASKLILDELPFLHKLQTTRWPDLYNDNWNCFLCDEDKETWNHLWHCSFLKPRLSSLLSSTKQAFETWINDNCKFQISHLPDSWNNLSVWKYPDPSVSTTTFDLMIKGLIPSDLTRELNKYLYRKDVSEAINLIVSKSIDIFHEDIWAYRCKLFAEKESILGIDQASKTSRSIPSVRQSPFSSVHRPLASPSRWKTWISQSLVHRKPWTDFRIYINS